MSKIGYIFPLCDLKEQLEKNVFYYSESNGSPNIRLDKYVYELTDSSLVIHIPADSWGFEDNYQFYPEQSIKFAEKEVRFFLLKKFGQEYLDFLFGPDVATLNPSFVEKTKKKKGQSKKLKRK